MTSAPVAISTLSIPTDITLFLLVETKINIHISMLNSKCQRYISLQLWYDTYVQTISLETDLCMSQICLLYAPCQLVASVLSRWLLLSKVSCVHIMSSLIEEKFLFLSQSKFLLTLLALSHMSICKPIAIAQGVEYIQYLLCRVQNILTYIIMLKLVRTLFWSWSWHHSKVISYN